MLWDIRALMKPALSIIDLIPNVHRTAALNTLRRAILEGRPRSLVLDPQEKELAFHEAQVLLTSPIGARVLRKLYFDGQIKLKKPAQKSLPSLDNYIATEAEFRANVDRILALEAERLARLEVILEDPTTARPDELTPTLIERVITVHKGRAFIGQMEIGGLICTRESVLDPMSEDARMRPEPRLIHWWIDEAGQRQGEV